MTRQRIWIAPEWANDAALRARVEADNPGAEIFPRRCTTFKTELTPIGEQFVVPGCERRETRAKEKLVQLGLWDRE